MTLTLTWGGDSLANPADETDISIEREYVGSVDRMLDASLRADIMGEKALITIQWVGLSASEKATIRTCYNTRYATASNLVIGNGTTSQTFSVLAVDGWSETLWYSVGTTDYYGVTLRFREV